MEYLFKYRRVKSIFWKKQIVVGHKLFGEADKMVLYFKNGGIREIAKWSECEVELGTDWVLAVKTQMEKEAGTSVKIDVSP